MNESNQDAGSSVARGGFRIWGRIVLFLCLAVTVAYVCVEAAQTYKARQSEIESRPGAMVVSGLITPKPKKLAAGFTDSQARLLADPPAADKLLDPDTLLIAHLNNPDEIPGGSWAEFEKHLATATGKKIADVVYDGTPDQLQQIKSGKISLVAIHPADAPFLVNNYGFEPVAVLGDEHGANGNHLDFIVPAGSSINQLADVKDHTLVCTAPSSITGYRAGIVVLMEVAHLRPNADYYIVWSDKGKQKNSIKGIADKKYEVAAVSDDKLLSMQAQGTIGKSSYKVIYQSRVIPRTTIGYFYNLKPELAAKVRQAILSYQPPSGENHMSFLPVEYKSDFGFVREIDDSFDPRMDSKTSKAHKE